MAKSLIKPDDDYPGPQPIKEENPISDNAASTSEEEGPAAIPSDELEEQSTERPQEEEAKPDAEPAVKSQSSVLFHNFSAETEDEAPAEPSLADIPADVSVETLQEETVETPSDDAEVEPASTEPQPIVYLDDFRLPMGTRITYVKRNEKGEIEESVPYTVVEYLNSGSFGNTYLVHDPQGFTLVLKEYCARGSKRRSDMSLDDSMSEFDKETRSITLEKFRQEPERVMQLFEKGKGLATDVRDDMAFSEAFNAARAQVGAGGVFQWNGVKYSTYTDAEKDDLNLVLPRTKVFTCFSNYYYVMDKAEGMTVFKLMENHWDAIQKNKNTKLDLDLVLAIMEQLAIAITNIHEIPCVHQDISGGNVIVNIQANNKVKLKVIDFGLAADLQKMEKDMQAQKGQRGSYIPGGTKGFTDITYNARIYRHCKPNDFKMIDIYSLGALLYFMTIFDLSSLWNNDIQDTLEMRIQDMHKFENKDKLPRRISEKDSELEKLNKTIINECYGLVKYATACTTGDFSNRCPSARAFLKKLRELMVRVRWVKTNRVELAATHTMAALTFNTNDRWNADVLYPQDAETGWVQIDGETAGRIPGDVTLNFNVKPNLSTEPREAVVVVNGGIMKIKALIRQKGAVLEKPDIHFPAGVIAQTELGNGEAKGIISVIANNTWSAHVSSEGYGWLDVDMKEGHAGEHSVVFTAQQNTSPMQRQALIEFKCGEKSVEWKVIQQKKSEAFIKFANGTVTEHKFPCAGGMTSFNFEANYRSHVQFIPETAKEWLSVNMPTFEPGLRTMVITAMPNMDKELKSATVEIHSEGKSISYAVKQEYTAPRTKEVPPPPPPPSIDVLKPQGATTVKFSAETYAPQSIAFNCNHDWKAAVLGDPDWLHLSVENGRAGLGQLNIKADNNKSYAQRQAVIRITAGSAIQDYNVWQDTYDFISKPSTSGNVKYNGNNSTNKFQCAKDWKIEMLDDSEGWIKPSIMQGGVGNNQVNFAISTNDSSEERLGRYRIVCGNEQVECTIVQAGKPITKPKPGPRPARKKNNFVGWIISILCAGAIGYGAYEYLDDNKDTSTEGYRTTSETDNSAGENIKTADKETLNFPQGQQYTIPHQGGRFSFPLEANGLWKAEVAESAPEGWLVVEEGSGDKKDKDFILTAKANTKYNPKVAKVKVTSGSLSRLVQVTQGIDRADSLETQLKYKGMSDITSLFKMSTPDMTFYEYDESTGTKKSLEGVTWENILRRDKYILDRTHDIIAFEEKTVKDTVNGKEVEIKKLKSITLKKRK